MHFSVPQPDPESAGEPPAVGLVLMPLRQTVRWLGKLERGLTQRLVGGAGGRATRIRE